MAQYIFGLDIGIASVGWAVLDEVRIIDLGVRCFDKAETADKGESLNLVRRDARLMRRRLWRRSARLTQLGRLFKRQGLIGDAQLFKRAPNFLLTASNLQKQVQRSPWQLRVEGLDRLLLPEEWAQVIYHLCKHRGFHWVSKAEQQQAQADDKSEKGKVKKALEQTRLLFTEKGYRTAAEMLLKEFPEAQRNKRGEYKKSLSRVLLDQEMGLLFAAQRGLGNPYAGEAFEAQIRGTGDRKSGLLWQQRPMQNILHMLGKCTFERSEYRAAKASFSAERHVWLTRLNNLRINNKGHIQALDAAQRQAALWLPYLGAEKFTYSHLKDALIKQGLLDKDTRFVGLNYGQDKKEIKKAESEVLVKLQGWHALKKVLLKADQESAWEQISAAAIDGNPTLIDTIAQVLSVYKDDADIEAKLSELPLPGGRNTVDVLLGIRFDKFSNLSLKALQSILPLMAQGMRYDEAAKAIYGDHRQALANTSEKHLLLPPLYENTRHYKSKSDRVGSMRFKDGLDIPRNPVVLRALNQARKVVNALIREYGSPHAVHIEMARDLSRPHQERKDIEKQQHEYKERSNVAKEQFQECFHREATGRELEKYLLYKEQQGKCGYSLQDLDLNRVVNDPSYVEVDHALPYSRSYDDSKTNKILVLKAENQNKGNRTCYEYLSSFPGRENGERWRNFVAFVESNQTYRLTKRNKLLRKNFGKEQSAEFRERNLNDTRYICRFFKNFVENHLQLHEESASKRCVVLNGQLTAFLRARWGFAKVREESDRHHALDAIVIAACSHAMVQRLANYSKRQEVEFLKEGFADPETGEVINVDAARLLEKHFPRPWHHFRDEVLLRLQTNDAEALRQKLATFGTYDEQARQAAKPLFVSRAPKRRGSGAAHKDTVYAKAPSHELPKRVTEKVALSSLTLKDLDRLIDPHRNEKLYAAIKERLEAYAANGGKFDKTGNKAFPVDNPLYKPDQYGQPTGPIVRTVTLYTENMSGLDLRGGLAKNDSMIRVDVFKGKKDGKYHLVPAYVHHLVSGLPNRAIVANKDENEWVEINNDYEFLFALCSNDLVKIQLKKESYIGYFSGCDRATGAINIWAHDRNIAIGKEGLIRGIGVKMAISFEKFHVDVLGRIYPALKEQRRGLA